MLKQRLFRGVIDNYNKRMSLYSIKPCLLRPNFYYQEHLNKKPNLSNGRHCVTTIYSPEKTQISSIYFLEQRRITKR